MQSSQKSRREIHNTLFRLLCYDYWDAVTSWG